MDMSMMVPADLVAVSDASIYHRLQRSDAHKDASCYRRGKKLFSGLAGIGFFHRIHMLYTPLYHEASGKPPTFKGT